MTAPRRPRSSLATLHRDDALRAAENMQRMGGGFASKLAAAYFVADSDNRRRILTAFDDLFRSYLPKPIKLSGDMREVPLEKRPIIDT